ncbi:MAG: hypothetical protein JO345_14495 [Streptosporangiaceae bacterium]|nr:hypothetical protein [Streptosporangiaceae bacterium]
MGKIHIGALLIGIGAVLASVTAMVPAAHADTFTEAPQAVKFLMAAPPSSHATENRVTPAGFGVGDDLNAPTVMHSAAHNDTYYVGTGQPGDGQSIADICTVTANNVLWYMVIDRNGVGGDHFSDTAAFVPASALDFQRAVSTCPGGNATITSGGPMFSAPTTSSYHVGNAQTGDPVELFCQLPGPQGGFWYLMLDIAGFPGDHYPYNAAWISSGQNEGLPSCD